VIRTTKKNRSDRIEHLLTKAGGRMRGKDLHDALADLEGADRNVLNPATVSSTVRQDNIIRRNAGRPVRFNLYNDGDEERGYISMVAPGATPVDPVPDLIKKTNALVQAELKASLENLSWQHFESNFLEHILDALGFSGISIARRPQNGCTDSLYVYDRGLAQSEAILSAKHWSSSNVGAVEVQRMRGIKGDAETAIIVTSSNFTAGAIKEAKPSQNQRSIVLVDGDLIAQTCLKHEIGATKRVLPALYSFSGFGESGGSGKSNQNLDLRKKSRIQNDLSRN